MGATVPVFLKHTFIGKASQTQPYTARAHSRYVQRQSATHSVHVHLMPESYKARQRWFFDHENSLRANGRVIDKFTITIPYAVEADHAVVALRRFGLRLGEERCPFMFTVQGVGSSNYHAHYVFVDRDYETGKRVFGTTDRNSTRNIKLEWEATANEAFAELGYDVRVKVRAPVNDNELQASTEALAPGAEVDTLDNPETASKDAGDHDMAVIEAERQEDVSLAANYVRLMHSCMANLEHLRISRQRVLEAHGKYHQLVAQREHAEGERVAFAEKHNPLLAKADYAKSKMEQHQHEDGRLKGWGVDVPSFKILGIRTPAVKFATPARIKATEAQAAYEDIRPRAEYAQERLGRFDEKIKGLAASATAAEREAYMRQKELERIYCGDDALTPEAVSKTLNNAEKTLRETIERSARLVPLEAAREAFLTLEITEDEYETYLIEAGHSEELAHFQENRHKYEIKDVGPADGEGYDP